MLALGWDGEKGRRSSSNDALALAYGDGRTSRHPEIPWALAGENKKARRDNIQSGTYPFFRGRTYPIISQRLMS